MSKNRLDYGRICGARNNMLRGRTRKRRKEKKQMAYSLSHFDLNPNPTPIPYRISETPTQNPKPRNAPELLVRRAIFKYAQNAAKREYERHANLLRRTNRLIGMGGALGLLGVEVVLWELDKPMLCIAASFCALSIFVTMMLAEKFVLKD